MQGGLPEVWCAGHELFGILMGRMFNALYDPLLFPLERLGLSSLRRQVVKEAGGRVLEIGIGTGLNLNHYDNIKTLDGIEPEQQLCDRAGSRKSSCGFDVRLQQGRAEELPFQDESFDSAVCTLVLCTVADPLKALKEIRRVLKPNSQLHLLEHVRLSGCIGHLQDTIAPLWKHLFGGCRLNQDTRTMIDESPLMLVHEEAHWKGLVMHWVAE